MFPDEFKPPVEIPMDQLSRDAVDGIIESFILREGTDYGVSEVSLEHKKEQIHKQLAKKEIKIVFDPNTESVTLMTESQWKRAQAPV